MKFSRQNFHHTRAAEASLTAAHACAGTALDAVKTLCTERPADRIKNFPLRDLLAAADDLAVGGLFADEVLILLFGKRLRVKYAFACGDKVLLFPQVHQIAHQLRHMQADGGGGGQAGRFDARAVDELLCAFGLTDNKFVMILMRAQTCKACDGLTDGKVFDRRARLFNQIVQTLCSGVRAFTVFNVDGCRTDDGVSMDGRADQNSLAEFTGQLKDGMRDKTAGALVQKTVITAPRRDVQLASRNHVVQHVRIDACGIDDIARFKIAVVGMNGPIAVIPSKAGDFSIELEFHAVVKGVFCQCYG